MWHWRSFSDLAVPSGWETRLKKVDGQYRAILISRKQYLICATRIELLLETLARLEIAVSSTNTEYSACGNRGGRGIEKCARWLWIFITSLTWQQTPPNLITFPYNLCDNNLVWRLIFHVAWCLNGNNIQPAMLFEIWIFLTFVFLNMRILVTI